jgi:hypothetical protein
MLKRTLIVVAVVGLLATSAQALGPDPHTGGGNSPAIKVNNQSMTIGWPFEYKALTICAIPVYMNVGYYVQVEKCHERKIKLVQVPCEDIGKSDWPCYYDCENVKIRANFEVKLGVDRVKIGPVIKEWSASVTPDVVGPSAGWATVSVCVKAWKTELWKAGAVGKEIRVGTINLTVKPNV